MLSKNVINIYTKIVSSIFFSFIFIMCLLSCALCSDSFPSTKKYHGLSFDKNKCFRYSKYEFYFLKDDVVYKKKKNFFKKEFEFDIKFVSKGLLLNKKYLVIYGSNDISVVDRKKKEILLEKKFSDKIILKPLIYLNSLYLALDYDKIISINLLSGDINWQYRNDVSNLQIHTNTKFIQSDSHLFYINSNRMHVINKYTGLMSDRIGVGPRHQNLNKLKQARIKSVKLYNDVLYIFYTNGILLAFDTKLSIFLWQKSFLNCKSFIIYRRYILMLRDNGLITLINKATGEVVLTYEKLLKKNVKKIIFLKKMNRVLVLCDKSIFIFKFSYRKLHFEKQFFFKSTDDVIQSSSKSIFLMSKNKSLKEFFFK